MKIPVKLKVTKCLKDTVLIHNLSLKCIQRIKRNLINNYQFGSYIGSNNSLNLIQN